MNRHKVFFFFIRAIRVVMTTSIIYPVVVIITLPVDDGTKFNWYQSDTIDTKFNRNASMNEEIVLRAETNTTGGPVYFAVIQIPLTSATKHKNIVYGVIKNEIVVKWNIIPSSPCMIVYTVFYVQGTLKLYLTK